MLQLLCSDTVMANYELSKETRLFVDHEVPEIMEKAWRPVNHTSRALTSPEQG